MSISSISVIVPTYNRAHLLGRAITSVLLQLEDADELIVVDDGSTDRTEEMIAFYGDRIRYILTENRGSGAARNRGVSEARNPLVAFLDSDDEWMPGKTSMQRAFMTARPDLHFCFTNYAARWPDGTVRRFSLETQDWDNLDWSKIIGPGKPISTDVKLEGDYGEFNCYEGDRLYLSQLSHSYVCVNTLIVRREKAGQALTFGEDMATSEEWECGARLARSGKGAYLDCETVWVHHHTGPRLVFADAFGYADARVRLMERVWGRDEAFLKEHGELYHRLLAEQRLYRIEGLLTQGKSADARQELAKLRTPPLVHRLLARLPGPLTRGSLALRRGVRTLLGLRKVQS